MESTAPSRTAVEASEEEDPGSAAEYAECVELAAPGCAAEPSPAAGLAKTQKERQLNIGRKTKAARFIHSCDEVGHTGAPDLSVKEKMF